MLRGRVANQFASELNTERKGEAGRETVRRDQAILKPRDMIDRQFFIWVQGPAEYE
jgi:hypothetical protein